MTEGEAIMKKYNVIFVLLLAILCILLLPLFRFWKNISTLPLFPTEGDYYCEELGYTLSFSEGNSIIVYSDGTFEPIYVDYGGRFIFGDKLDSSIAFYAWETDLNLIEVEYIRAPADINENKIYCFMYTE